MLPPVLDLKDSGIQLWQGDQLWVDSPGFALWDGDRFQFGESARDRARLHPREVNTRFWWQLDTEPLKPELGVARHTADLAHGQLGSILDELNSETGEKLSELVLAVPGSMSREQLSLLLGIVQAYPFEAKGLVNRSVLLASYRAAGENTFHLELQLHQSVLNHVVAEGPKLSVRGSTPLPGCGLLQLQERLVETLSDAFIRQTRFDPRHSAVTEQALYQLLPEILERLGRESEINVELAGRRARVGTDSLRTISARLVESVNSSISGGSETLLMDPQLKHIPGIAEAFPNARQLADTDLASAYSLQYQLDQRTVIQVGGELHCILSMTSLDSAVDAEHPKQENTPPAPKPTHLLKQGVACPLGRSGNGSGWQVREDHAGWIVSGEQLPRINGEQAQQGIYLQIGDQITMSDGSKGTVIAVEN